MNTVYGALEKGCGNAQVLFLSQTAALFHLCWTRQRRIGQLPIDNWKRIVT
ncbi:proprotein convertase subtilisin/kexin type 9 [Platysternon megacephalum]|uniref:Proprotein convertase subtilisin/kexin type 9 n=1 Tax=Platysternon megacephalum TaxID=55544 RepID=A0A4D9EY46_9SAUR|nr:proprotein convertase subtilisin/kexin type 9 [Platysternon megacephalum]